ncbi:MAG: hypothetical protein WAK31_07720 [Chthoniobacterales bacterium]
MNKSLSQLLLTVIVSLIFAGLAPGQKAPAGYSQADYEQGLADAQKDTSHGVLAYEFAGLPAPTDDELIRLMKERYNIEMRRVAGDEVLIDRISHMIGYNEIALPEIQRRFGKDILQKVADEAKANYEKEHKQ